MPGLGRWLVERGWRMKRLFVGCVLALVAAFVSAVLVAPIGAAPDACVVKNKALKETYASLQEGIDAASAGDELVVRGTCVGTSTIAKDLTGSITKLPRNHLQRTPDSRLIAGRECMLDRKPLKTDTTKTLSADCRDERHHDRGSTGA